MLKKTKRSVPLWVQNLLLSVGLLALGVLIYSNTFQVPFHFDDRLTIVENPYVKSLAKIPLLWHFDPSRFLTYLSFSLNYHFGALDVTGYHWFNLSAHILTTLAFFVFVHLTMKKSCALGFVNESLARQIVIFSVFIFMCHPIQTQAVTYISQRSTMMATFFYLLTLNFYILYKERRRFLFYGLALLATAIGLFTKPIIVTLPMAIFLYEVCFYAGQSNAQDRHQKMRAVIFRLVPFILLVLVVPFLLVFWKFKVFSPDHLMDMTRESRKISRGEYLLTQFNVIVTYLRLLIFPVNQNLDYDFPIAKSFFTFPTWLSFTFLVGILFSAVKIFRKQRIVAFGIFWFFVTLSLESSVFPISDVINEHRLYLPMVGCSIVFSYVLGIVIRKRVVYASVAGIIIALLSINTYQRNFVWGDRVGLLVDVIEKSPEKARMYNNLGIAYMDREDMTSAQESFKKAIALDPEFTHPYNNLANSYFRRKQYDEAKKNLEKAIELSPEYPGAHYNLGNIYLEQGDIEAAERHYINALNAKANFVLAIVALGKLKAKAGNFTKANFYFRSAIGYDPGFADAYSHLADLYLNQGDYQQAMTFYKEALKRNPSMVSVHNSIANLWAMQGDYDQAVAGYRKAIQLDPGFANAYFNLSNALKKQRRYDESMRFLQRALTLYNQEGNEGMAAKAKARMQEFSAR